MTHVNSFLRVRLLDDPNRGVCDENEENDQRLYKCTPPGRARVFKQRKHERDDGRREQNENELVLELFKDELP